MHNSTEKCKKNSKNQKIWFKSKNSDLNLKKTDFFDFLLKIVFFPTLHYTTKPPCECCISKLDWLMDWLSRVVRSAEAVVLPADEDLLVRRWARRVWDWSDMSAERLSGGVEMQADSVTVRDGRWSGMRHGPSDARYVFVTSDYYLSFFLFLPGGFLAQRWGLTWLAQCAARIFKIS